MKQRFGFVSNSSSSSFVIHKSEFPSEESFFTVIKLLSELREELEDEFSGWGENEQTFYTEDGYLFIETNYVYNHILDTFLKAGIDFKSLSKLYLD